MQQSGYQKSYEWSTAHSFSFGFTLLNVDCSAVLDLLMRAQTCSRRYDVSNDHTLTAVDPLVVEISIICTYQPANHLPFLLALDLNRYGDVRADTRT